MRLIKREESATLRLVDLREPVVAPYAILSHTWGENDEEVTPQDFMRGCNKAQSRRKRKSFGWRKIEFCSGQAARDDIQHFWIDTCCIVKENSTELQKAINSMFRWYQHAAKCYVYLTDVSIDGEGQTVSSGDNLWERAFQRSRWFQRGWTLQELLAPKVVEFYSKEGHFLGSKESLKSQIHKVTGIPLQALHGQSLAEIPPDERFRWIESRKTSEPEDLAYSMLGIFDIHMPLIYGEGTTKAFRRLREETRKVDAGMSMEEDHCLQCLYPSGMDYDQQKNQNPDRVPGTCLWTLDHPKYIDWRDKDTTQLLWISADPGCGKSVLAKCIVDEDLPKAFRNDPPRPILYYFFKDTGAEQRSACRAISTILHQLFSFFPKLIQYALPKFRENDGAVPTKLSELCTIFNQAVTDPAAGHIICVLDALDECNEDEQLQLISFLEDICLVRPKSSSAPRVKFLITSRPEFKIRQGFDKLLAESDNIELAGNDESRSIMEEIDLVIKDQIVKLQQELRLTQQVADHLQKRLLAMEHRTYLWIHLLWEIIRRNQHGNKSGFNKLIDNLPADIEGCYEHLLQKSTDPEFASKVLDLVLVAARPLTVTELDVAMNIEAQTSSYADLEDELEGPCRIRDTIQSRCGMMVSVIQSKVYFIHQTVKDFLLRKAGGEHHDDQAGQISTYLARCHLSMSTICIQNLCFRDLHLDQAEILGALLPMDARGEQANNYCQIHPFLSYSAMHWADHFSQGNDQRIEIVENLLETGRGQSVKGWRGRNYGTPLHAASARGHSEIVHILVDRGADVNAQGGILGNALQIASARGNSRIVQTLLDGGADVNAQGGLHGSALRAASRKGHEAVVHMLIARGANV